MEKRVLYIFIFVLILGAVSAFNIDLKSVGNAILNIQSCSDGTEYGKCSVNKEFFCDNGTLKSDCGLCGCGDGFNCLNNQCVLAESCEQGNGICNNQCEEGYIELQPLTSSCNIEENNNGNIDISNSVEIKINSYLKNANKFRILENIYVNAFIQDTEIQDGYTLLVLYPEQEYSETLSLLIPENIDRGRTYILDTQVSYSDIILNQQYELSASGGRFSFVIKNVTFANNQKVRLGDDLIANFEIINRKCCIKSVSKIDRFYGYCSYEEQCSDSKPLICRKGILIEDCASCGCQENYFCSINGKCTIKISGEEIKKFYDLNNIDQNEQAIVGSFVREFSRIPKSPETTKIKIEESKLKVEIENVKVEGSIIDKKPQININLNQK
ncbi:hypothetical protein HYX18_02375 [Candidatus Woesearchaeota archaeon]|nr:hypothetical protein [Candidatus Woesearchaeota archaeon]